MVQVNQSVVEIEVNKIRPDPRNLRKVFAAKDIRALGRNIKKLGQLDPVKVFPNDDGTYDLLDGERRWRAALAESIPILKAIIEERPDQETLICKRISRALQTKGLSKPEEVRAIEDALTELDIRDRPEKWNEYAERLGGDLDRVKERMRVADLPLELRKRFDEGEIPYTIAQSVGRISDRQRQVEALEFILTHKLSNRFVATQFISHFLQHPDLPLMAVYDLARHAERWRYAKPVTSLQVEQSAADKFDDLIDSFIKAEQALEEAAAAGFITEVSENHFYRERLFSSVQRLLAVLNAFLDSYQKHFKEAVQEPSPERRKLLLVKEQSAEYPEAK